MELFLVRHAIAVPHGQNGGVPDAHGRIIPDRQATIKRNSSSERARP